MALVDYSSSDESTQPPPSKRRKAPESEMPPLPAAFHDLYASTVRPSVSDDPSLHQGRKRVNPHVPGNWPTHVYIEWHPTKIQHDMLEALVKKAQQEMGSIHLHNFLTSDLGTDLPLHISLSRPLSLPSAVKDEYLTRISAIGTGSVSTFSVRPAGLAWYTSPDSDRTFFVLRVVSAECHEKKGSPRSSTNPELVRLLDRCNAVAEQFGQPPLYQSKGGEGGVDTAFHVSIGWTMGAPDEETCLKVLAFFRNKQFAALKTWRVGVDGFKVKIGNVVSAVSLGGKGERDVDSKESLFGL